MVNIAISAITITIITLLLIVCTQMYPSKFFNHKPIRATKQSYHRSKVFQKQLELAMESERADSAFGDLMGMLK